MASSTSYNHHPLPAPPLQQDPSYTPYNQQLPAAQDRQYQSRNYPQQQTQYQQQPQYRQQQQREQQQQLPPPDPKSQQPPPPPQQQQQQRVRPRSRAFSFRSDKSQKGAASSTNKGHLAETTKEKEARRLHSKADPMMALSEREPAMEAQIVSVRPALRSIQHKDLNGNPIADPDRSNPTRSRWERPLDTIRGFEAAIDGGYNRKSLYKPDADPVASWNRRNSYYGNNGRPQESWYGGRPNRTEYGSYDHRQSVMVGSSRDSYYEGFDGGPYGNGGPNMGPRNKYSRHQSEPHLNGRERNVYPIPNNHRSYETVASGSGSGSGSMGEPQGYQTDPTGSENSSINRRSPPKRQEPMNDYGISFGQSPSYQTPGADVGETRLENPPPLPQKETGSLLKKQSKSAVSNGKAPERPELGEKRKSWFTRRFSKNS